ncbi:MAG: 16S rRNA (guanine(527)-N(7))-methyltransferase RsmG [Actinobacteria bacterium]|nr:MAG: 16S rRNA (guanine(527)-N(7))-methyltransferase RsmG [Actinomycetota bacterium]
MVDEERNIWGELAGWAAALGLDLSERQLSHLKRYVGLIGKWNRRIRLVGDPDPGVLVDKHIADSLTCVLAGCITPTSRIVDVGAGAGLPGIPLAIALGARVTLIEANAKKSAFLSFVREALRLEGVAVVAGRAEELAHGPMRESFDVAVARGLASLSVVLEYCLPLVQVGGCVVAQKGVPAEEEVDMGRAASATLGGGEPSLVQVPARAGASKRSLIVVRKESPTPERFPRKPGAPAKRPLGSARR